MNCMDYMKESSYCIVCSDPFCANCRTDYMCSACFYEESCVDSNALRDIRIQPITQYLQDILSRQEFDLFILLIKYWKNGNVKHVEKLLESFRQKYSPEFMRFIEQIENVLCDPDYIVDINNTKIT